MKKLLTAALILSSMTIFAQNGLDFDGLNDYVQAPNAGPIGNADRTIELWLKTSNSISTQQVLVDWGNMNTGQRFTLNMINFGRIRIEVGGNGFNSTATVADGNWHHIAVTYNDAATTKFSIYIDGVLDISNNTTIVVNTANTNGVIIGKRNDNTNYFKGTIDEVRIWSTVRTISEISSNMNQEFCSLPAGLMYYYQFNQGDAGTGNKGENKLLDAKGDNNATLYSFSLNGAASNWVSGKNLSPGLSINSFKQFACDSYLSPSGTKTWTTSNKYRDTLMNSNSCDSLVFVNLTIGNTIRDTLIKDVCDSFPSPSGKYKWAKNGTYFDTILNGSGCNTYYTIDLTATLIDTSVSENGNVFEANENGAFYQWVDCDNNFAKLANANSQQYTPSKDGSYAVTITNGSCVDTSGCHRAVAVGLMEKVVKKSLVYPNPFINSLKVKVAVNSEYGKIKIVSISGALMYQQDFSNASIIEVNTESFHKGLYFLEVEVNGISTHYKLLKN